MSKTLSRITALDKISNWSTTDVLSLLRKNDLDDCCKAVEKRQIDGEELLHLTEGKLALWKSDLTRQLTCRLWRFVEELKESPEKYVSEKNVIDLQSEELVSDSGSWGSEFEDDIEEDDANEAAAEILNNPSNNNNNNSNEISTTDGPANSRNWEFRNSLMLFRENEKAALPREKHHLLGKEKREADLSARNEVAKSTYTNCENDADPTTEKEQSTYANCAVAERRFGAPKNVSNLHAKFEKTLAEKLNEQLMLRNSRKPTIGPKPEISKTKTSQKLETAKQPQKSFLHDVIPALQQQISTDQNTLFTTTIPDKPQKIERSENDLPRPPVMLRNFDLVANLPTTTDGSEDEYEAFDEQIIELNKRLSIGRVDSKQSLNSARHSSLESIYKTSSTTSQEKQDETEYEIYESITETPEDDGYYRQPIEEIKKVQQAPPPLPAKPANSTILPSPTPIRSREDKKNERSPDKKSATLPHPGSGMSLTAELRATRPLPPPPDKQSYMDSPWFHNVTREQATALIKDRAYGNGQNGYFLIRPSTSHPNNPLALVLWFKDRVYNVPVRKRPDNRYALGSAKVNEQSFASVEEIVKFYSREELVLHTGGVQTGSTKLIDTPPK